ncbi:DUF4258 domain-containing protein [Skermanella sp. TT6]|uniref:DUF4258 domain-containing protein n=1 Tax=Skermanella cutis TaxID=2775420 RepID=A0ABX7B721_9PROT|nr:DUF4258 domain-containing protein [Skermanella sp. TT6]QQP90159.1 DUF4258 domain-containing protein [Skermanella sp. TT6]
MIAPSPSKGCPDKQNMGRQFLTGSAMAQATQKPGDRKCEVRFTSNALHALRLRNISEADVLQALSEGSVSRVDDKSGHTVLRMGDVRIVTQGDGASITVLTAMRTSEFPNHAE